jgi:predicted enzyme related to lactoylglutathione lyase
MSQRDGYEHGVPSWIAGAHPEPREAAAFYTELFGWDADTRGDHLVCTLRGQDVAGFLPGGEPAWRTHVWVESADKTADRAREAGGTVLAEPTDVPGVGRTATLADPAGAVFTVAEPEPHRGAQVVNEPGAWAMSELSTPDTEAANAFYAQVFGWETDAFGLMTLYRLPGFVGGEPSQPVPRDLVAVGMPGETPQWGVGFWVDDVDATAERAQELGGAVLQPPQDDAVGRTAVLQDPQGAAFAVSRVVPA